MNKTERALLISIAKTLQAHVGSRVHRDYTRMLDDSIRAVERAEKTKADKKRARAERKRFEDARGDF